MPLENRCLDLWSSKTDCDKGLLENCAGFFFSDSSQIQILLLCAWFDLSNCHFNGIVCVEYYCKYYKPLSVLNIVKF